MSVAEPAGPRVPHVYVLICLLTVATALAGLVIPSGSYERDAEGRVVPDSFAFDDGLHGDVPRGPGLILAVLEAPLRGIVAAADIIAFILVIGGAFKVIDRSGAFAALIRWTVERLRGREILIVPVSMLLFSVGGAVFGMGEEILPFVILFVPMLRALGYPGVIGVAIPLIGSQIGFAGAMINPFTVGVAQAISGLPPLSGWQFRSAGWVAITALGIFYVMRLARRLREAPETRDPGTPGSPAAAELTRTHVLVLTLLAAGIGVILWGIGKYEWYVLEIGAIFLAVGLLAAAAARIPANDVAVAFLEGGRELLGAALVVGLARGVVLLALDLRILDTVLHGMSAALRPLHGVVSLNLMFLFQSVLNFFVPSGSGQAALTMPIMAPLADLAGLSRQMAVLAFQFGDGFSNMIIPTSAVLMGSLEAGKVPYARWFRLAWPFQLWCLGFGFVVLSLAVAAGYGS